jgi:PAS domain-containing protein
VPLTIAVRQMLASLDPARQSSGTSCGKRGRFPSAVLVEDSTAFVETLEVVSSKKRADKRRVHRAAKAEIVLLKALSELRRLEHVVECMEQEALGVDDSNGGSSGGVLKGMPAPPSARELEAARAQLTKKRDDAAAKRSRHEVLERERQSDGARATKHRMYRLHSSQHHVDCSASKFEHLSDVQRAMPVWITTTSGQRWWWFLDRFWWDAAGLKAEEVLNIVLDRDRERDESKAARERALGEALGRSPMLQQGQSIPEHVRIEVWQRDGGRCVDCGAAGDLAFDFIIPVTRGGARSASNVEVRCNLCFATRRQNQAQASASRARFDARPAHELRR